MISHDPGGKVRLKLDPSVKSSAVFSSCFKYRRVLTRTWDTSLPTVLFIGMNPSTADTSVDDPTVRKECGYARDWGFGGLVKVNVMDYRATYPKDLLKPGVTAQTHENLASISSLCTESPLVIAAWGKIGPKLQSCEESVRLILLNKKIQPKCLGVNIDGSPKHPLYLRKDTQPQDFIL